MSSNPLNLALRFFLELAALFALGYWGWVEHDGVLRVVLSVGLMLLAATIWGVFRVPGDPGDAPVEVSGPLRLLIELAFFGSAIILLIAADQPLAAAILAGLNIVQYALSYDRIIRFLSRR